MGIPAEGKINMLSFLEHSLFRRWCDDDTPLIKSYCDCSLNAKLLGSLYAGAVEKSDIDVYLGKS